MRQAGYSFLQIALLFAISLRAQTPAAAPQMPLVRSETRDVVVDVVVTKSGKKPVLGLTKQDFQILEDGKPQSIDFFEEHSASSQQQFMPPQLPPMPPGTVTNAPTAPEGSAVNVLLLDYLNTEPQDQVYVHRQIMDFLEKMKPGTRMAIFLLGSQLRCVQGFTSDGSELVAALKKSGNPSKQASFHTRSDNASDEAQIGHMELMQHSPFGIQAMQAAMGNLRAHDYGNRASITFQALNYIAQYLAGVPGRKNLVWFAGSFPVLFFPEAKQHSQIQANPPLASNNPRRPRPNRSLTCRPVHEFPHFASISSRTHILPTCSPAHASPCIRWERRE